METEDQDFEVYKDLSGTGEVSDSFSKGYIFRLQADIAALGQTSAGDRWCSGLRCVYLSPSWEKISSIPKEDAMRDIGKVFERIHADDAEHTLAEIHRCMAKGSLYSGEFRYNTDGGVRRMQMMIHALHENGVATGRGMAIDITERCMVEEELQDRNRLMNALVNNLPNGSLFRCEIGMEELNAISDPMRIFDVARMTFVGNSWGKVSGTTREQALSSLAFVMGRVHADDQQVLNPAIYHSMMTITPLDIEVRYFAAEDVMRWIRISLSVRKEADTVILEGVVLDVSDRKKAEYELKLEKQRIETLANNLPEGALHRLEYNPATDKYRAVYLSANWGSITKGNREAALKDVKMLFATIHPDDLSGMKMLQEESLRTMTDLHCIVRLNTPAPYHYMRIDAHPYMEAGVVVWDGLMIDITAEKCAEDHLKAEKDRLESLGNNLHGGCLIRCQIELDELDRTHDPEHLLRHLKMSYLSASWEQISGVPRDEAMQSSMSMLMKVHPDDRKTLISSLFRIITFRQSLDIEVRYRLKESRPVWLRFSMQARLEGGLIVCDGFILDVTRRKEYEIEMAVYRDELEMMVKVRTDDLTTLNEELTAINEELTALNDELAQKNNQLGDEMTARNELLRKLEASEGQLRGFIDRSYEGILIFDHKGRITEWNRAMETITGLARKDVVGEYEWDVRWSLEPDEKRTPEALEDIHRKRLEFMHGDTSNETRDMTLYTPTGAVRYTNASLFRIETTGTQYFGRIVRDITHQRKADIELGRYRRNLEQIVNERTSELAESRGRLVSLSNNLPGGVIFRIQDNGQVETARITYVSEGFTSLFGIDTGDLMKDINLLFNLFEPEDGHSLAEFFASAGSEGMHDAEVRLVPGTSGIEWLHMRSTYRTGPDGVRVWDSFMVDITERKNAARELEESYHRQELLTGVLQTLQSTEDIADAIRLVVAAVGAHFGMSRVYIFEKSTDGLTVDNTYEWCAPGIAPQMDFNRQIPVTNIDWFETFEAGGHICTTDISVLSYRSYRMLSSQGVKSLMVQPLSENGVVFGYLGLDDCLRHRQCNGKDMELVQNLAQIITSAIRRHRAETGREKAQEALAFEHNRLQAIGGNIPNGTLFRFQIDAGLFAGSDMQSFATHLQLAYVSSSWERITNMSAEASMQDVKTLFARIEPEDFVYVLPAIYRSLYEQAEFNVEMRYNYADGDVRWLHVAALPHLENDRILTDGFIFDVTDQKNIDHELEETRRRQSILIKVLQTVQSVGNLSGAINTALSEIGKYAGVSRSYIFEKSADGRTADNVYEWCGEGVIPEIDNLRDVPIECVSDWFDAFKNDEYICASDIRELSPLTVEKLEPQGVKSILVLPLEADGVVYGFVGFDECAKYRTWQQKEVELLISLSQIISSTTIRFRAQESMQLSQQTMRTVLDNINASIYVSDFDTYELLFANKTVKDMIGGDIEGKLCWQAMQKGITGPCPLCPNRQLLGADNNPAGFYQWEFRESDTDRWYDCTDVAVKWVDGRTVHMKYATDITGRKQAEFMLRAGKERIEAIGDNYPDGCLFRATMDMHTQELKLTYVSKPWEELTGISAEDVVNDVRLALSRIHPDDQLVCMEDIIRSAQTGENMSTDLRFVMDDGSVRWAQIASHPHTEGHMVVWDGFFLNITGRKNTEAELIRARERAEESDRLKSAFLANMSHEILTPLNGISGLLNAIADDTQLPGIVGEHIAEINHNSDRLIAMITEVLDASRLATGQMPVQPAPVNLSALKDEMFGLLVEMLDAENKAHIKAICVRDFAGGGFDITGYATIHTDPVLLRRILTRLLGNAVKFTESGSIRFGWQPVGENLAEFFVEDTGIGIPAGSIDVIFRPFRQLNGGYSRRYGGMGLGLSVSYGLAQLLGGDMRVTSTEGKGSRFMFTVACNLAAG